MKDQPLFLATIGYEGAVLDDFITTWTMAKRGEPLQLQLSLLLWLRLLLLLLLAIRLRNKLGIAHWLFMPFTFR